MRRRPLPLPLLALLAVTVGCPGGSDAECASDDDCVGGGVCNVGICIDCDDDADCAAAGVCDDGECVDGPAGEGEGEPGEGEGEGDVGEGEGEGGPDCVFDMDCPPGTFCVDGRCVGEGEGEGEGEDQLDEGCEVFGALNGQGSCAFGLVCVPLDNSGFSGICRVRCGELFLDGAGALEVVKDAAVDCGARTCQAVTPLPGPDVAAVACVPPGLARDDSCRALLDDQACPPGLECQPTTANFDDVGNQTGFASANCKEPCDPLAPACTGGDECLPRPFTFPEDVERDADGLELGCAAVVDACRAGDDDACPCDLAAGYRCVELQRDGAGALVCHRRGHNCGEPVAPLQPGDDIFGAPACNEVDDSRYCDDAVFDGAPEPVGTSFCLRISQTDNEGVCFAFCSSPSVDVDGDGLIAPGTAEEGDDFGCGTGFVCSAALSLELGIFQLVSDPNGLERTCDLGVCPVNTPCPGQCGPGDVVCSDLFSGATGTCLTPFGACAPSGG